VIAGTRTIIAMCDDETQIIPGHGPLVNKANLVEYLAMLEDVRGTVAREMAAGKELEAIQAAKPGAAYDADWGVKWLTSDQFVEMVFDSLAGK